MVDDDRSLLKSVREVGELGQLVMEHPGIEAEAVRREMAKACAKCRVEK